MRVIELSNHPGDMLTEVSRRRRAAEGRAQNSYEHALIQYQARVQTIRVKRDRARRNRQWWTWLRLTFAVRAEKRRAPRLTVPDQAGTDAEEKIRAGIAGEQLVATDLGRSLATTGRCCAATATGAARSTTCCSVPAGCSPSR